MEHEWAAYVTQPNTWWLFTSSESCCSTTQAYDVMNLLFGMMMIRSVFSACLSAACHLRIPRGSGFFCFGSFLFRICFFVCFVVVVVVCGVTLCII